MTRREFLSDAALGEGECTRPVRSRNSNMLKPWVIGLGPMAKILKQRGNNIDAGRRGSGGNRYLGDAFPTPGQGREVNFPFHFGSRSCKQVTSLPQAAGRVVDSIAEPSE